MFSNRYQKKKKVENFTLLIEILRDATWDICWVMMEFLNKSCSYILLDVEVESSEKKEVTFRNRYSKESDVKQVTKAFKHIPSGGNYS